MRILYIAHNPPVPLHNGGSQRTHLIHRVLRTLGEVDLVIVSSDGLTNREELTRDWGLVADFVWMPLGERAPFRWLLRAKPDLAHRFARAVAPNAWDYEPDPAIASHVRVLMTERHYDVVVGRHLRPTVKAGVLGSRVPCVLDLDDLDTKLIITRRNDPGQSIWKRAINRWHYYQLRTIAPALAKKFDLVWYADEEEGSAGEELRAVANKAYLPNIPVQMADQPVASNVPLPSLSTDDAAPTVLFVGNFWVMPNIRGVDHFVHHIWPKIHVAEPRTVFRIVGAGMNNDLKAKWSRVAGVDPVGFVPDLQASYAGCRFAVVPVFSGSGTNIKVVEALRFGRTCVLARFAHRGYGATLPDGEALRVTDDDDAFAAACVELLRDPAQAERLARRGREAIAQHYSFERFSRTVSGSIRTLLHAHERPANKRCVHR